MRDIKIYEAMAKLALTDAERDWVMSRAAKLTAGFAELEAVDTDNTTPLVTVLDIKNVLREDVSARHISRDELMAGAPEQYDGYFRVPKTVD
ncbi:MAG: Asp-tRNA(Asn)/Glu-tRNA(Gln) amidotransferase subunit GatC [Eubacteriales bacterium]|jgi:aspartyl/glutamyl-tRNA(Asn/Gln) amidotransferase C subunit|nr:Asp-tRNA(Asn)/Glu-tRNA(Gln) amidotransferase subunit GatC [Eubacteriales bacterium]